MDINSYLNTSATHPVILSDSSCNSTAPFYLVLNEEQVRAIVRDELAKALAAHEVVKHVRIAESTPLSVDPDEFPVV